MLNYNPKDANECWPCGEYEACLRGVMNGTSKTSGNEMETWTIEVFNDDGRKQVIKDYVTSPGGTFKIKQLAAALGKNDEFKDGTFQAEDYIRANFRVDLKVEAQDGFDNKNRIAKFKPSTSSTPAANAPTGNGNASAAKASTWNAFKSHRPSMALADQQTEFRQIADAYAEGADLATLTAQDWQRLAMNIRNGMYDNRPSPISQVATISKDSDIPF